MDYFSKKYYETCKDEFSQFGFVRKRGNIVRVVNDVMQNFNLKRFRTGYLCTVEFGVIPLCYKIEKKDVTSGLPHDELQAFDPSVDQWEYDKKSEKSMDKCIHNLIDYMKTHLIPFFQSTKNCAAAYPAICELEKTNPKYNYAICMIDYRKYCMSLKNGHYDLALAHLKAIEQQNMNAYISNESILSNDVKAERLKKIEKRREEIRRIENGDKEYIDRFIIENEAYSLNSLGVKR